MIEALGFRAPRFELLAALTEDEWRKALDFCDRTQLTLPLGLTCGNHLPEPVRSRIDGNLANTAERWRRIKSAYLEIASALEGAGLEFVVLKGFTHCPRFVSQPWHRRQGDLDLLLETGKVQRAYEVAIALGYVPIRGRDRHPINHLPTLIRKTGWEWRGDHFDVEIPTSVELHFQVWNAGTERFAPVGLEHFWPRREQRVLDDLAFTALHPADTVANAALHMLRHLLRGSLQPFHVHELAWMLDRSSDDTAFWNVWLHLHDDSLRRLEAICFSLARHWFECRLPDIVRQEIDRLPGEVTRWLAVHSFSPLAGKFLPNKDELWLHWSLLESTGARLAVLRRRLLPERLPGPVAAVHVPDEQITWRVKMRRAWRYVGYSSVRATHHLRALPPTAWSGLRWFGSRLELGVDYWWFFLAEGLFNVGMFVFVFFYNLYLLQIGFDEKFVGFVASSMTVGSVSGTVLSALLMRRFGTRRTLLSAFALAAVLLALRASLTTSPALLALAFLAGMVTSAWPVALAPVVAQVTTDKSRPLGFSLVFSSGIGIGILATLAAGRLPGWLAHFDWASTTVASYRGSLLIGCAFVLLAMWPLSQVKIRPAPAADRKLHRPSPILIRFLAAMFVWNLATGLFNPFRNVFFVRMHMPVANIGYVFSSAQLAQVIALLAAPMVFRRFGLTGGISGMQLATSVALVALAAAVAPAWAAVAYTAFMMAQYMSEPGLFTLLMQGVKEGERGNASALNFLVSFGGQAIAAAAAGALIARLGYPPVLVAAAIISSGAALLFRVLLAKPAPDAR